MSVFITQFTVCITPSNPMSKLKVDFEMLKVLPAQDKFMSNDLSKVKSNHNYMHDMVLKLKDRGS